jgi:hypothetical protein
MNKDIVTQIQIGKEELEDQQLILQDIIDVHIKIVRNHMGIYL